MVTKWCNAIVGWALVIALMTSVVVLAPAPASAAQVEDTTRPLVAIEAPLAYATVASPVEFSGTARDDIATAEGYLAVKNTATSQWLQDDGSFDDGFSRRPVGLASPGSSHTAWSIVADLPDGRYRAQAVIIDSSGNKTTTRQFFTVDSADAPDVPRVVLESPKLGATAASPVEISGQAFDNRGVAEVYVAIRRNRSTAGTGWLQTDGSFGAYERLPVELAAPGATATSWKTTVDLLATDTGYNAHAIVFDVDGNRSNYAVKFAVGTDEQLPPRRPQARNSTCAGVRGNGQNLFAHYGALARHVEEYGPITCVAGGSSGSITAFLLESMWANANVHRCHGVACTDEEQRQRLALMLKSVIGLVDAGVFQDVATVQALVTAVQMENIVELLQGPLPQQGVDALVRVLRDLGPLINPDVIELLLTSPDPVFHATDIIDGLQKGLQFIVDDPKVFLRTSVIDFGAFADLIGVYGSFYAGYGPADSAGTVQWFADCAQPSRGKTWEETAALPAADGRACGDVFADLFNQYRESFADGAGPSRINDPVGTYLPAFGVTGVLTGNAIRQWEAARKAWIAAEPIAFEPDFADIGVGYWGRSWETGRMQRNLDAGFDDLGSRQFVRLGAASWREVLSSSPAEPGFSPGVPLESGFVSVGGWADPLRVTPLAALGAKRTITINRLGGVGGFTAAVTELLNASEEDLAALYSTTDPASSFYVSLETATGVWCTDWDGQGGDPNRLFNDAYTSPFITDDADFVTPDFGYPTVGPGFVIGGCTPGVEVPAAARSTGR